MNEVEPSPRNFDDYKGKLLGLPLERTLEFYRRREILEALSYIANLGYSNVLEVGIGTRGVAVDLGFAGKVTLIEPIKEFLDQDGDRDYRCEVVRFHGTFEKYMTLKPEERARNFDLAILSSVLHELPSASEALRGLKEILRPGGLLLLVVPNRKSLHRLIGSALGIEEDVAGRTESELKMGQRAAYTINELINELAEAGFEIHMARTFLPKLLSSHQLETELSSGRLTHSFLWESYLNSQTFEPFGSEILMVARNSG